MMSEGSTRHRWFLTGCILSAAASLGLILFPVLRMLPFLSDVALFSVVCVLTVIMGAGATLAIFNLQRP